MGQGTMFGSNNSELTALKGKRITLFCMNYIYTGKLHSVGEDVVTLKNPAIVYETGAFTIPTWQDAQNLPQDLCVKLSAVESFGVMKQ